MNVLSVRTNTNLGERKMSEKMSETKLLTPDDLLIQDSIARKHRWTMSTKQHERRQIQVLDHVL